MSRPGINWLHRRQAHSWWSPPRSPANTWLGKAPRGYPIEETSVKTEAGRTTIDKVELLEISEAPLNPSIFELPVGYRLALQTGNGGADLTKPDTIPNRAQYYWARLTFWARGLFR